MQVPIEAGFFELDPLRLLGSRCPSCEEVFFPRRLVCARCLHEGTDDVDLSTTGTLHTWTYCHVPLFGKKDAAVSGYGVGQIDLPEGPRVQSILVGGPDDFAIGMTMQLGLESLGPELGGPEIGGPETESNDVVIYRFGPLGEAS